MPKRNKLSGRYEAGPLTENYMPVPESGCWLWLGAVSNAGYGKLGLMRNGKKVTLGAHRAFYEAHVGPIPEGFVIMHSCDNKLCVNPSHLRADTQANNMKDKAVKKRSAYGQRNARSKLTDAQVLEIYSSTEHWGVFAEKYGVSYWTVRNIKAGKNWSQVTGQKVEGSNVPSEVTIHQLLDSKFYEKENCNV